MRWASGAVLRLLALGNMTGAGLADRMPTRSAAKPATFGVGGQCLTTVQTAITRRTKREAIYVSVPALGTSQGGYRDRRADGGR